MKIVPCKYTHSKIILLVDMGDNKYNWIVPSWLKQLDKYWDWKCGIDIVAVSYRKKKLPDKIKQCIIPVVNWSNRISWYLGRTTARYFLLSHEDYFLTDTPDYKKIFDIVASMEKNKIRIAALRDVSIKNETSLDFNVPGNEMTHHIPIIETKYFAHKLLFEGENAAKSEHNVEHRLVKQKPAAMLYRNRGIFPYIEILRTGRIRTEARLYYGFDHTVTYDEMVRAFDGEKIRGWTSPKMSDTILLVYSGDKNSGIWPIWWEYFKKHWDFNCGIDVVWVSELKLPQFGDFRKYMMKKCIWSNGLIHFLNNYCTARYIIYMVEDFLLLEPPNYNKIIELVNKMKANDIHLIRTHHDRFVASNIIMDKKYDDLYPVDNDGYLMTFQAPIISKDLLLSVLAPNESIWATERRAGRRIRNLDIDTYIYLDEVLIKYIEVMRQGKIKPTRKKYVDAAITGYIPTGYLPEDNETYMQTWHSMRTK